MKIYRCEASFHDPAYQTMTAYIRAKNGADAGRMFIQQIPAIDKRVSIKQVQEMPEWATRLEKIKRG